MLKTCRSLLKNGKVKQCYFTFSYSGVRGDTDKIEGSYAVALETTEAFLAKQERVLEGDRLRALFHQAPGFMAVTMGQNHKFEIVNDAFSALFGRSRELIGKTVKEAVPEAEEQGFLALLDEVYSSGSPYIGRESRFACVRETGQPPVEIYVDFIYQPVLTAQGRATGIMMQGHEVSEAYNARQALLAADRQKDQFIATLAHELRSPLAPIRAASSLLQLPNVTPNRLERATGVISRQVDHMAKLLDDLLDVARIARNQIRLAKETVSVENIIAMAIETAKPTIEKKNQQIIVRHHGLIQLHGDPVRLTQAISNLVCNAAKYTDQGGEIIVSTSREDNQCRISVQDSGIGIDPRSLATVFDMFAQEHDVIDRSDGGLGIGLGLVKGLVNLHEGRVFAESEGRGKGSTFTVILPCLARNDSPEVQPPGQITESPVRPLKVLVADDNVDLVNLLTDFLEILGHQAITAYDGATAYTLAKQELPDLAILDVGMPDMNGYELAQAIRKEEWGREMTLIAATGWGTKKIKEELQRPGLTCI